MSAERHICTGNGVEHCCVVNGVVCEHYTTEVPGRKHGCALRHELGSWERVHADPRYAPIQAHWNLVGIESCGAFVPQEGACCRG